MKKVKNLYIINLFLITFIVSQSNHSLSFDGENDYVLVGDNESLHNIPDEFALHQNNTNSFNARTNISYDLPNNEHVSIVIYDVMGRNIRSHTNENKCAGYYRVYWDARNDIGEPVSAGIYIHIPQMLGI